MIIFLYGPDTYRSRRALHGLRDRFSVEVDSASLAMVDGATASLKEIGEKINTGSLFVNKRMILIDGLFANKSSRLFDELADFLEKHNKTSNKEAENILVFHDGDLGEQGKNLKKEQRRLFSFLASQKYSQEFKPLSKTALINFVKNETAALGRQINSAAINSLLVQAGTDLWNLATELHKLAMSLPINGEITSEQITAQTTGQIEENIFALTDAIANRQKKAALSILEEQYSAGLSENYILTMLTRQFKIMLQIKSARENNLSPSQIASELRLHPYVIKKTLTQIANFSLNDIKKKLNDLVSLDFSNKTGASNLKIELSLFIAKL
jgi:DNA polymerase-3 subunit delta